MDHLPSYGFMLKVLADCMASRANRDLQSHNLTFSQSKLLRMLSREPEMSATLKSLEEHFHQAQSTVAGLVIRLEKKGLVESFTAPNDRRVKCVRLTEEGVRVTEACHADFIASEERLLSLLSEEERTELRRMLRLMYEALQESAPNAPNMTGKEEQHD